jgi:hypothetical protein
LNPSIPYISEWREYVTSSQVKHSHDNRGDCGAGRGNAPAANSDVPIDLVKKRHAEKGDTSGIAKEMVDMAKKDKKGTLCCQIVRKSI